MNSTAYPRIEYYFEKDYNYKNTSNQATNSPDNLSYKTFVNRRVFLLDEKGKERLLATKLTFLSCFKEEKPSITLQDYFNDINNRNHHTYQYEKTILPKGLDQFLSFDFNDKNLYLETIIEYQKRPPKKITIVRINENNWYVDKVFYKANLEAILKNKNYLEDEKIVEGTLLDFMRFSNCIQPKLDEGYSYLRIKQKQTEIKLDEPMVEFSLSPGMPGSRNYVISISGNGDLKVSGNSFIQVKKKINSLKLIDILSRLDKIDFDTYVPVILKKRHVNDGQTISIHGWSEGIFKKISFQKETESIPKSVTTFIADSLKLLSNELLTEEDFLKR